MMVARALIAEKSQTPKTKRQINPNNPNPRCMFLFPCFIGIWNFGIRNLPEKRACFIGRSGNRGQDPSVRCILIEGLHDPNVSTFRMRQLRIDGDPEMFIDLTD